MAYTPFPIIPGAGSGGGGGSSVHNDLTGRSAADAHPTSAITGLDAALAAADAIPETLIDAKGDVIVGTAADTAARLAVGSDGQVITADPSTSTNLRFIDPAHLLVRTAGTYIGPMSFGSVDQQVTLTANFPQFSRIWCPTPTAFDQFQFYVHTASSSGVVRISLYLPDAVGAPSTFHVNLVPSATTVGTGWKTHTVSGTLPAGPVWVRWDPSQSFVASGASGSALPPVGWGAGAFTQYSIFEQSRSYDGTDPSPLSGVYPKAQAPPIIRFRVA